MTDRVCDDCGELRPHEAKGLCKRCYRAAWTATHREHIAEYNAFYQDVHADRLKASQKRYRLAHPERVAAGRRASRAKAPPLTEADRQRDRAYSRRWRAANRSKKAAESAAWRKANPEKVRALTAAWRRANPERAAAQQHRRRARKLGNGVFVRTPRDRRRQLARQRNECFYCPAPLTPGRGTTEDHVVPLSRGGTDGVGNIVFACLSCNSSKNTRTIMEWRMRRVRLAVAA